MLSWRGAVAHRAPRPTARRAPTRRAIEGGGHTLATGRRGGPTRTRLPHRGLGRAPRLVLVLAMVTLGLVADHPPHAADAAGNAVLPPDNPAFNLPYTEGTYLDAVNTGRAVEGLAPIATNGWGALTSVQQVFAVINLERVARALPPFQSLTASLDALAEEGADARADPPVPAPVGSGWQTDSIEAGTDDPLLADFGWMYEDGCTQVRSQAFVNTDCAASPPVPWHHRDAILDDPPSVSCNLVMGAAISSSSNAVAADLEFYCGTPPTDEVFTWADALRALGAPTAAPCQAPGPASGYRMAAADGGVFDFGAMPFCGSAAGSALAGRVVAIADSPNRGGYWMAASDGGVFAFGDAAYYGSMGGTRLSAPIVGMAAATFGNGYWLVAKDGGVFAFGVAPYYGSMGGTRLSAPIVGMAVAPFDLGYWLVAADGGVFAFGYAAYYGSMGGARLDAPIVGMAPATFGNGYWLVAKDGGVFAFGVSRFYGSAGGSPLSAPVVGIAAGPFGLGYWLVAADGGVFTYGFVRFSGSAGGTPLSAPVVGMAT